MIFNGHTEQYINSLDEELFAEIQVMYSDGLLGNKGIFDALTPITTAIFNYLRGEGTAAFKPDQIFPWINEYGVNPDLEPSQDEITSTNLIGYIAQAKNFKLDRFKNGGKL